MNSNTLKKAVHDQFLPHLGIAGAFPHSSAISSEETELVAKLLERDAKEHHIFFNDKGFHNHLTHMLLADYSLGATPKRLNEIYEQEKKMQRPKLPKHCDFEWTEHLGDENYYSDYLDFMLEEVKKLGRVGAVEKYAFDEQYNMLSRWLGGVYHPFIHTGYGFEFGNDIMIAEGLAQTCVHADESKILYKKKAMPADKSKSSQTALEIAKATIQDDRFDGVAKFEDMWRFKTLLEKKPDLVLEYVDKWALSIDPEDLLDKARELIVLAVAFYAGPQRPGKEYVFDFFLMHSLTSSLFLPIVIQQIDPKLGVKLLRGKFAEDLAWYISRNRPVLNLEQFESTTKTMKPWSEILELALQHGDEHVPKVIRALKQAERYDSKETLGQGVIQAIASITVDSLILVNEEPKDGKRWWEHAGIGFDELWSKIPDRKH